MRLITGIVIVVIIVLVAYQWYGNYEHVLVGAREWKVVGSYENAAAAAALLARVNARMIEYMRYLRQKYHIDETDDVIAAEGGRHIAGG